MVDYCEMCKHKGDHGGRCMNCIAKNDGTMIPTNFEYAYIQPKPMPNNVKLHGSICSELSELYAKKNADYGDSFHKTFLEEGMAMPRIRLSDKLERFKRLTRSGEQNVKDESVRDTLIDLANYAIMTVMELDGAGDPSE